MNYLTMITTRGKVSIVKAFIKVLAGHGMMERTFNSTLRLLNYRLLNKRFLCNICEKNGKHQKQDGKDKRVCMSEGTARS